MRRKITFGIFFKPWLISALFLFGFRVDAQVYFGASGGLGFPLAKQVIAIDITVGSSGYSSFGAMEGSFGQGFFKGLFAGYQVGEHFSGEIGIEHLSGSNILYSLVDTFNYPQIYTRDRMAKGRMTNIIPATRFTIGENKFRLSIRTGLLIGLNGQIKTEYNETSQTSSGQTNLWEINHVFRGGVAWGFLSGLGLNYSLNSWISFYAEAQVHAQTWGALKSTMTKYTYRGTDQLGSMPVSFKESEYEEKATALFPGQDSDNPSILLKRYYSFSSYGFSIGVIFKFHDVKDSAPLRFGN
jgi:hypothetical protein